MTFGMMTASWMVITLRAVCVMGPDKIFRGLEPSKP